MRRRAATLGLLLALSAASPSNAGDQHEAGVNLGYTGVVVTQWVPGSLGEADTGYSISATCSFAAAVGKNLDLIVAFGGAAEAVGPEVTSLTSVTCTVYNTEGAVASSTSFAIGPVAPTAQTTGPWPLRPITVCVRGSARFASGAQLTLATRCAAPALGS